MKQIDKKGKESDLLAGDDVRFYFLNCGIQLDLKLTKFAKYCTLSPLNENGAEVDLNKSLAFQ